jgi:hypothetical protein
MPESGAGEGTARIPLLGCCEPEDIGQPLESSHMPKTKKKRRSPRPPWMIALDPVALKKSKRAKRARDDQRKRGFELFALDKDGVAELLRDRLDWDPYVVTGMCFTRWQNGHPGRLPRKGEELRCSLAFLRGGRGKGAYAVRDRNLCWTFALPRKAGAPAVARYGLDEALAFRRKLDLRQIVRPRPDPRLMLPRK